MFVFVLMFSPYSTSGDNEKSGTGADGRVRVHVFLLGFLGRLFGRRPSFPFVPGFGNVLTSKSVLNLDALPNPGTS